MNFKFADKTFLKVAKNSVEHHWKIPSELIRLLLQVSIDGYHTRSTYQYDDCAGGVH